jgi:hypothetical protein
VVTGEKWALSYGDNMDYNGDMMVDKDIYIYKDDYHTFMNELMKMGFLSHGGSPVVTSRGSIGEWNSLDLDGVEDLAHVMPPAHFNVGEDRNALRAWPSALLLGVQSSAFLSMFAVNKCIYFVCFL